MTITQKQTCQYGRFFCNYFLKLTRGILGVKVDGGFIMSFSMQNSWSSLLEKGLQTPAMRALEDFLAQEIAQGKIIHPQSNEYFRALDLTPIQDVKVEFAVYFMSKSGEKALVTGFRSISSVLLCLLLSCARATAYSMSPSSKLL
jgi:hypothetical protein